MLLSKVVPAIKENWPTGDWGQTITIQQDNAGPHIDNNNKEFCLAIKGVKPAIKLGCQPAQSLETNVLDLGLFWAIDCAQKKIPATNFKELVVAVPEAFEKIPWWTIDKFFLTLMATLNEIICHKGKNNFPTPHIKKDRMKKLQAIEL